MKKKASLTSLFRQCNSQRVEKNDRAAHSCNEKLQLFGIVWKCISQLVTYILQISREMQ